MSDLDAERKCSACQRMLPTTAFAASRSRLDGLQGRCRECGAEAFRRGREARGKKVRRVDVPEGHKHCLGCDEVRHWSEWHRNAAASDGLSTRCKPCRAVKGRADHLKRQYGMTEAERDEMIASQMGLCVICLKAPPVHVDHCHETGRVRGVLCFNCNSAIGKLGDDPDAVRRAAAYLEGSPWKPTLVAPGVYRLPS
ncbi:endonuclease VII domain-containing protein [Streptomyces sp. WI04-05B]|uniref:endonuclease VII domain-containing protein n=1 Tax=Streptomyces TaxID=1883 RepID=UPI0029B30590|nr:MULTISPECIES: endonuclease VII domain-containing protein [unclassified Streptomyces]MDX2540895.1 endonuclease VII domain-containing protein [Streptomyces sp. WI04-05B]MDX2586012.1 endonuclease VII domain-containing protein [Streptomyces sp. WI04-05A]